jgi:PAS domain S-box-containing protein
VVARFDRALRHIYVSDSIEAITGKPREFFMGRTNRDLGMPDDLVQLWDAALHSVWDTGQAREIGFTYPAPDGRLIYYECNLIPELSDNGTIGSVVSISRDITGRKQAELLLQQSEEKFRMTFEGASDAIFWADADSGMLINCNRAAEAMLDLPRVEIIGRHQTFLHPPEMAEHAAELFRRAVVLCDRIDDTEAIVVSRNGRRIPVHIKHSVTRVGDRTIVQGLFRDISEQKRAEAALVELNQKLRALSDHLQTVQERERLAMARDIHDEIGQSLTVLKLDLEWIGHRLLTNESAVRERVNEMRSNIEQLTSAVQRIAADLRPPLLDSLGLAAAIDWQVAEFGRRSGIECFVMLNEEIDPLEPQLATAVMRIVQEGLTNILRHARATEVSVSLCRRDGQLVLEIGDNGRGIRSEEIESPQAYGLMGMQERARICRGELAVRGAEGGGTLLRLTVPLRGEECHEENPDCR